MKRSKLRVILPAIFLSVAVIAVAVFVQVSTHQLINERDARLAALAEDVGRYDERSIVMCGISLTEAESLAEKWDASLRSTKDGSYVRLTLPVGSTISDVFADDANLKYISMMSADYKVALSDIDESLDACYAARPQYTVTDAGYSAQTYLDYLGLGDLWQSYRGAGTTIAVIDSGIDTDHAEFANRISIYSYNATEDKIVKDFVDGNGNYDWSLIEDEQGHGTAVAGIISAAMDGIGTVGIAPEAELLVIKAECDSQGVFERTSDLVFGLYYAIERDVDVVNMSFGTYVPNPFQDAAKLAYDSDIVCVAAAGNNATSMACYPAADPHVIGVGAIDESWQLASYSNYGDDSDVVAPGTTYTTAMGGGYELKQGTSMSSPIVAAIMGLYKQTAMYDTNDRVTEILFAASVDLGDLGEDWDYGYGAVDAAAFVREERGTVTFEMLSDEIPNDEAIFVKGHTLQSIPEPERPYAVFDGWYYDDTFTEEYRYYEDTFTNNITLYAKWSNEDDGIPYSYVILEDGTVEIRSYTGKRRYITVPEKIDGRIVSSIGDFAFSDQTRIREITLPSGLNNIGGYAFANCTELRTIRIPRGVCAIGEKAFGENVRLRAVVFEAGSVLHTIGDEAFSYCVSLTDIVLPGTLENVDGSVFYGASSLKNIYVDGISSHLKALDGVLYSADMVTLIAYPVAHGTSYTLHESTGEVGKYAFAYANVKTVDLSGVNRISDFAFANSQLSTIDLPDSVTAVGKYAFSYCGLLNHIRLSENITVISQEAFQGCISLAVITIPQSVQQIDYMAFSGSGIREIVFSEDSSLRGIGAKAFFQTPVVSVTMPRALEHIGESAFSYCKNLRTLAFEADSNLAVIYEKAFANSGLTSIALPEGTLQIGEQAFYNTLITEATVPASVEILEGGAFAFCPNLTGIAVANGNQYFHSIDGVVYSIDNTKILAYPAGASQNAYTLLSETRNVESFTFAGTGYLDTVYLSEGLAVLGPYSFFRSGIEYISLPESLVEIGENAFEQCTNISNIFIPDNVIMIGRLAFAQCNNLYEISFSSTSKLARLGNQSLAYSGIQQISIPPNVSTMGQEVFRGCTKLCSVYFAPNSQLESIGAYMFDGCTNLQNVIFHEGSALTSIQAHGFEGIGNLYNIDLQHTKLETVDNFAFRFCGNLQSITLPSTVTSVGRYAFYGCENLAELTLPANVEHIGSYAFLGTKDINIYFASESLPAYLDENWDGGTKGYYVGVQSIRVAGEYRYAVLTTSDISIMEYLGSAASVNLAALDLGGNIVSIGGGAFKNSPVAEIILPETLREIHAEAFMGSALRAVTIPSSVAFIGHEAFALTPITTLAFAGNASIKTIESYAFHKTANLKSVMIPSSVTALGAGVFMESGLEGLLFEHGSQLETVPKNAFAKTHLASVLLPDSVTLIDDHAFYGVETLSGVTFGTNDGIRIMANAFYGTGLHNVYIPENVTYIGEYSFVGLTSLASFEVAPGNPNYKSENGLLLTKNGRKLIAVPAGLTGTLTVPVDVEEMGFGAFENTSLSAVYFHPNANILTLGYRAFFGAKNIREITIPASVVSMGYYAFAYCESLERVIFADGCGLTGIYEGVFCGDINLAEIALPDTVIEISDFAFYGCSKITQLSGVGVKCIYDYAYAYTGLSGDLVIPAQIEEIGDYAFLGTKVASVVVSDTNKYELTIGLGAFEDCLHLREITLPFIGRSFEEREISWFGYIFGAGSYEANAAYVPPSLEVVTITEGLTEIGVGGFAYCTGLKEIHVPHSVTAIYNDAFRETTAAYELTNVITTYYYEINWNTNTLERYAIGRYGHFGKGIQGSVTISDQVTEVGGFVDCAELQNVVIPYGILSISAEAFQHCSSLQSMVIPDSVVTIGPRAFAYCQNLRSIKLSNRITEIAFGTFYCCENLVGVQIPNTVTRIDFGAFVWCENLQSIILPDSVSYIGEQAFVGCGEMRSVTLPANLEYIDSAAFESCYRIYEIYNNSSFPLEFGSTDNGQVALNAKVIVERDGSRRCLDETEQFEIIDTSDGFRFLLENGTYTLVAYTGNKETITLPENCRGQEYEITNFKGGVHVIIPSGFTHIDAHAFEASRTLRSVSIPDTVTSIDDWAFSGTRIEHVDIPNSVTQLGYYIFSDCAYLESVHLPNSITELPPILTRCTSLKTIVVPDNVRRISNYAFSGCSSLADVTLPRRLEEICPYAFADCPALRAIEVPESVMEIGTGAFSSNTEIILSDGNNRFELIDGVLYDEDVTRIICVTNYISPNFIIPNTVSEIVGGQFEYCSALESVTVPEGITYIGGFAFSECTNLKNIILPATVTRIEVGAFYNCSALEEIILPADVNYIGNSAFFGCSSLKKIVIPENVSVIGDSLFYGCTSLEEIVPLGNITSIGANAFAECIQLSTFSIPYGVVSIGDGAFMSCKKLESVTIPETVDDMGFAAFAACEKLSDITLPSGLTVINESVFAGCGSLMEITIPEGVTSIEAYAFSGASISRLVLPDTVASIENDAFNSCKELDQIVFSENLKHIGERAFLSCSSLMEITIPQGVETIAQKAFGECSSLYRVNNQSALDFHFESDDHGSIAYYAKILVDRDGTVRRKDETSDFEIIDTPDGFRFIKENGQYTLRAYLGEDTEVTLPANIYGNPYEIYHFSGAERVIVPEGIERIGYAAFWESVNLERVVLPNSLVEIGSFAFWHCANLQNVNIPDNVKTIGSSAFMSCYSLQEIHIPESVQTVGDNIIWDTFIFNNPDNWTSGMLIVDGWLLHVDHDVEYLPHLNEIDRVAHGAYTNCNLLKNAVWESGEIGASNVETLIIKNIMEPLYLYNLPITLKNIIISDTVRVTDFNKRSDFFSGVTGVTIFVEANEEDLRWDDNFPGWNNGNRVVYCDSWIWANFYDEHGTLESSEPKLTTQVIRRPVLALDTDEDFTYEFIGWDLDGDGVPDSVPATSVTNIDAHPVITITGNSSEDTTLSNLFGSFASYPSMGRASVSLYENGVQIRTIVFEKESVVGLHSRGFVFEDLKPGVYDLVITCEGHLPYIIYNILVLGEDVDLTNHLDIAIAEIVLPAGDVNFDGFIDLNDVVTLTSSTTYGKNFDQAANKSADINGDGCFDLQDLVIITSEENYGKAKVEIAY